MIGKAKSLIAVDIGGYSVKAVEIGFSGAKRLSLTNFGVERVDEHEAPEEAVIRLLKSLNTRTKKSVSAVSGRSVIVRYIPMMLGLGDELKQAAINEADKYIPFDVSEVVLDCQRVEDGSPMPTAPDKKVSIKILLVAVKTSFIEEHVSMLRRAGLSPAVIDVDAFALGNAYERWARDTKKDISNSVTALVDIGAGKTNINIMKGNNSLFTREIYMGGRNITDSIAQRFGEKSEDIEKMKVDPGEAEDSMRSAFSPVLEEISAEIRLSFEYFENQFGAKVNRVFLSGGTALFPRLNEVFTSILNIPTETWNSTEGLELGANIDKAKLAANAPTLAVAMGLASRLETL